MFPQNEEPFSCLLRQFTYLSFPHVDFHDMLIHINVNRWKSPNEISKKTRCLKKLSSHVSVSIVRNKYKINYDNKTKKICTDEDKDAHKNPMSMNTSILIIHHWVRRGCQSDSYSHLTCMFLDCGRALDYLHNALEHAMSTHKPHSCI